METGRSTYGRGVLGGVLILVAATGCQTHAPDREIRMTRGYVYYLDGAGGGGAVSNYGRGVYKGLADAGYAGAGEMYRWQTGLGVGADQVASESYKREKAAALARKILEYRRQHPTPPITVIGLSAGTAIAVFALEALPAEEMVENVILLSGSLSANYDLTEALRRVRGTLYVFSSSNDAVLRFLLPLGGTADRAGGTATIGLQGVRRPASAAPETRRQYQKVVEVGWNEKFRDYGNMGGHTDTVKARFIEAVVAPLVLTTTTAFASTAGEARGEVANVDYTRWAQFAPGSWAMHEGTQTVDGVPTRFIVKVTLVRKDPDRLILHRTFETRDGDATSIPIHREFFVPATIEPGGHPATDPHATIRELPAETIAVGAEHLVCQGRSIDAPGQYAEWGQAPRARVYANRDVPGGIAQIHLTTLAQNRTYDYVARLVRFHVE